MKPKFNNKPNTLYKINNEEVWKSRSCAVVGVIFAYYKYNDIFILAEKRSKEMESGGLWAVPGGYMDWNESGWDAIRREVYEETNFLIDDYDKYLYDNNEQEPIFVKTEPDENRQNIALLYTMLFKIPNDKFPWNIIEKSTSEEVDMIRWINLKDISKYKWAFNHDKRIKMAYEYFLNSGIIY
ncbi:NUDIX hydrolase [bacterium]|jgi:8-oxo-dGTP pyrophosphatase MutT (NUDIX family)|nr:NUDIX hydrolase [bacterium]